MILPNSRLLLITPPDLAASAAVFGLPLAHTAYRVGRGPHLLRANLPVSLRGGLMVLDSTGCDGRGDPGGFCQEVLRECAARGFDGVLCDFDGAILPLLGQIVAQLGTLLEKRRWPLYVPEAYARFCNSSRVLIPSALSGGSLTQRLREAADQYGPSRLALAVERVAEDFYLPAPAGRGIPLTREELAGRIEARSPAVFFSRELCAHYFTYMTRTEGAHFILFDDAASLRKKIHVAAELGITHAVLAYPQVDDILREIIGR